MHFNKIVAKRLSILLYSISILLWSYFILTAELIISSYGLIHSVNLLFFMSIFFLTISFLLILKYDVKNKVLPVATFTFYIMLYLLPFLLEKTPRFIYSYHVYGYTEYIVRYGHINTEVLPYQNWPGVMYLGSILTIIAELSGTQILVFYPIIIKPLSLIFVYWILSALSENIAVPRIGVLIYLIGDWTAQQLYLAPSLGLFFYISILSLTFLMISRKMEYSYQWAVVLMILSFSIIVSHLLSSIATLASLLILYILVKISNRLPILRSTYVILFSVILLAWLLYPMGGFLSYILSGFVTHTFNVRSIVSSTEQSTSFGTSLEHAEVMYIKMIYTTLFSALAALGILYALVKPEQRKSISTITSLALIVSIAVILPLIVGPYSGEIISRAFGYTTPFLTFFIARNWNKKLFAILIVGFLVIAPPLFVISAFGNEKFDYVSPSEIAGVEYYYKVSNPKEPIHTLIRKKIWSFKYIEEWRWKPLDIRYLNDTELFSQVNKGYVAMYDRDVEGYIFLRGYVNHEAIETSLNSEYFGKIYSSKGFNLFKNSSYK